MPSASAAVTRRPVSIMPRAGWNPIWRCMATENDARMLGIDAGVRRETAATLLLDDTLAGLLLHAKGGAVDR